MSIWRYANPLEFMRLSGRLLLPMWVAAGVLLAIGLGWVLFATPDDYKQGSTVKILFIHVPAAMLSINTYAIMAIASGVGIIRRHHHITPGYKESGKQAQARDTCVKQSDP